MYVLQLDDSYFKGFEAMLYLDKLESDFKNNLKKWRKEKRNRLYW